MKRSHFISRTINGLSNLIIPEDQRGEVLTFDTKGKQEAGLPVGQLPIVYQPDYPYIMVDPRVSFLKRVLSLILQHHNSYLNPFAFRLRSLKDWTIKVVVENFISQMAWACKSNCVFCYQKGNPPFMKTKIRMSRAEIMTRLKYFTGETCLIYGMQYESDEVLNNPYIKQILRVVRANTCEEIRIPTNGNSLTPEFISFLRTMRPISLLVSINSADARTRTQFTGDAHPEIAIRSFSLLKEHGIPYFASIVAWPGLPFSDIEKTIKYAEKNDAWGVRVSLPGYSRYFSPQKPFDDKKYWIRIVKYICLLKKKYDIPILIIPNEVYQKMICNKINIPIVIGAIKNSPAYNCGIRPDDLIVEINKRPIDSTEEAMELLLNNLEDIIEVKINRRGKILAFKMKEKQVDTYPYIFKGRRKVAPFGIFLVGQVHSLSNKDIEYIKKLIIAYRSKRVLLLTSAMIYRHFKYLMKKHGIFDMIKTQTKIAIAKNYFLGGSICAADLLTTEDYIRNIKMQMRTFVPDLIILPCSPFNVWKRDLTGRVNMDIEREIGIPVEFVYNG